MGVEFDGRTIFQDLNFEHREKETLAILGPNGAGKTVLLRALLGLMPFSRLRRLESGRVYRLRPQRFPLNKDLPVTVADLFSMKRALRTGREIRCRCACVTDRSW